MSIKSLTGKVKLTEPKMDYESVTVDSCADMYRFEKVVLGKSSSSYQDPHIIQVY